MKRLTFLAYHENNLFWRIVSPAAACDKMMCDISREFPENDYQSLSYIALKLTINSKTLFFFGN